MSDPVEAMRRYLVECAGEPEAKALRELATSLVAGEG